MVTGELEAEGKENHKMAENEKNFEIRTDLAVEERESFPGDGGEIAGVALREWRESGSAVKMTEVQILDEHGARAMGKPEGVYLTLEADGMAGNDEEEADEIASEFAVQLSRLLLREQKDADTDKERGGKDRESGGIDGEEQETGFEGRRILIVGLGNTFVTPDALGPRTAANLRVTRHLDGQFGEGFCRERHLPLLSAIVPGVMAQTGMESAEILKGIVGETKPEMVVVIDALAARSVRRLGTTIQLTDTGIHPGSGVGNHRHGLTRESLGVPVFAVGVPTVVGATSIVHDTISSLETWEIEAKGGWEEHLRPELRDLYVTPPDIDERIQRISKILCEGIHRALFERETRL